MKIGLVDIDSHAKVKKWGATIYPNLALCKIAAYHKKCGDEVEWAMPLFGEYDIIYRSKIFNFSKEDDRHYNAKLVIYGGTGYSIASKLPPYIDDCQPDYSIYPTVPQDMSFGFLTRGCPNKCNWCVVPRKEGAIRPYWDIERVANGNKKLVLMDNNILAAGDYAHEQLEKAILLNYRIDFNQALDARLVDDDFAKQLAKVKWLNNRIRFGCDTQGQIGECEKAISLINSYGYRGEYFLYTMLNDDFVECYNRLHYWWERNKQCRENHTPNIYPYAQPFRDPDNPKRPIPDWQLDMARWVNKHQVFQVTDFDDFEPRKSFKCIYYKNKYITA